MTIATRARCGVLRVARHHSMPSRCIVAHANSNAQSRLCLLFDHLTRNGCKILSLSFVLLKPRPGQRRRFMLLSWRCHWRSSTIKSCGTWMMLLQRLKTMKWPLTSRRCFTTRSESLLLGGTGFMSVITLCGLCICRRMSWTVHLRMHQSGRHTCLCAQAEEVKRAADQVSQLRRVGKGLGVFEFDRALADVEA